MRLATGLLQVGFDKKLSPKHAMYENLKLAPPDPVFGLLEKFRSDPRDNKVNLTVGVYQDENGQTPILNCVRQAEHHLAERGDSKSYLPIDGNPEFNRLLGRLVLSDTHPALNDRRSFSAQTPGGTAALRIAAEVIAASGSNKKILFGSPTWANHYQIFDAVGLESLTWKHLDESGTNIDFDQACSAITQGNPGDGILLHAVCHNPTGFDYNAGQWQELLRLVTKRGLIPVFDFAYQGFDKSVESDAQVIRDFCAGDHEAFICSSFSKNFGLYAERTGGLTIVGRSRDHIPAAASQIKSIIRTMYSTPPAHGGRIVATILSDPELKRQWLTDVDEMRNRIHETRENLAAALAERTGSDDFEFINRQSGMFSFSGLNVRQSQQLRDEHAVYIVENGRINVAGLNQSNIDQVADAIAAVSAKVEA